MTQIYQVKGWDEHFESAKSRTYNAKRQTYCPNKHGLGYRLLVRQTDPVRGAALFGAWRAMTDVLSRQPVPRQGYCTDTGRADGLPLTPLMFEALTDIPAELFTEMIRVASSQEVDWLRVTNGEIPQGYHADTTGIPQGKRESGLACEGECKGNGEGKGFGAEPKWSLKQCEAAAEGIALAPDSIRAFHDHYAAVGFIDGAGREIVSLPHALAKWKSREHQYAQEQPKESYSDWYKRMEAEEGTRQ